MKKIYTLAASLLVAISANAQAIYESGQHDNLVTVALEESSEDLQNYPIDLCLSNPTIGICSVSAYFYIDDNSIRPWLYDEDEECYAYDYNSKRCYKSVNVMSFLADEDNPKYPGYFFINAVDTKNFKLTDGTILTFYMDATKLSNGNHKLHIVEPMCSYVDDTMASATYKCVEQVVDFNINAGTLTIVNGMDILYHNNDNDSNFFDLTGRVSNVAQRGIYIKNGRKVIR